MCKEIAEGALLVCLFRLFVLSHGGDVSRRVENILRCGSDHRVAFSSIDGIATTVCSRFGLCRNYTAAYAVYGFSVKVPTV